ncbi:unnamed protein product, partial [Prorocentrum cordatum]
AHFDTTEQCARSDAIARARESMAAWPGLRGPPRAAEGRRGRRRGPPRAAGRASRPGSPASERARTLRGAAWRRFVAPGTAALPPRKEGEPGACQASGLPPRTARAPRAAPPWSGR